MQMMDPLCRFQRTIVFHLYFLINVVSGRQYNLNNIDPNTDPCGTLYFTTHFTQIHVMYLDCNRI